LTKEVLDQYFYMLKVVLFENHFMYFMLPETFKYFSSAKHSVLSFVIYYVLYIP